VYLEASGAIFRVTDAGGSLGVEFAPCDNEGDPDEAIRAADEAYERRLTRALAAEDDAALYVIDRAQKACVVLGCQSDDEMGCTRDDGPKPRDEWCVMCRLSDALGSFETRAQAKKVSREHDAEALTSGEKSGDELRAENGLLSAFPNAVVDFTGASRL
jgi:hypothetical protein